MIYGKCVIEQRRWIVTRGASVQNYPRSTATVGAAMSLIQTPTTTSTGVQAQSKALGMNIPHRGVTSAFISESTL